MTDLSKSGWRGIPDEAVRRKWEEGGGAWQECPRNPAGTLNGPYLVAQYEAHPQRESGPGQGLWRPIHEARGWNHEAWMWAAATGEPVVPTEPGLWWRDGHSVPVEVEPAYNGMDRIPGKWEYRRMDDIEGWSAPVTDDGHWTGPVVMPERVGGTNE